MSVLGIVVVDDAPVLLGRYNIIRRENEALPTIAVAAAATAAASAPCRPPA